MRDAVRCTMLPGLCFAMGQWAAVVARSTTFLARLLHRFDFFAAVEGLDLVGRIHSAGEGHATARERPE
jgi:hypothetical protein